MPLAPQRAELARGGWASEDFPQLFPPASVALVGEAEVPQVEGVEPPGELRVEGQLESLGWAQQAPEGSRRVAPLEAGRERSLGEALVAVAVLPEVGEGWEE